jgi:hypothetical protein
MIGLDVWIVLGLSVSLFPAFWLALMFGAFDGKRIAREFPHRQIVLDDIPSKPPRNFVYMGGDPIFMTKEQEKLFLGGLSEVDKIALRIGEHHV